MPSRSALVRIRTIAAFVAGWLWAGAGYWPMAHIEAWLSDTLVRRLYADNLALRDDAAHVVRAFFVTTSSTIFHALWFGTIAWTLGFLVRMIARARLRSGERDFFGAVRAWASRRRDAIWAVTVLLGAAWSVHLHSLFSSYHWDIPTGLGLISLFQGVLMAAWVRIGTRAMLAPVTAGDSTGRYEIGRDEIVFDAVAVTPEAKLAVAGVALLPVLTLAVLETRVADSFLHGGRTPLALLAYAAVAVGVTLAFRLASRVAVGLDGVHVRGTSRAKFHAYRDLDEARANGSDLELVRRGRVVVRLQLHGDDAARRDAVLARIRDHIARVKEGTGAATAQIVASSSKADLLRAAQGAGDYRMATLTREQLWALVEGPEIEGSARKAAAEALVRTEDPADRARVRVAAERCAEPQVREALEEIADEGDDAPEAERAARRGSRGPFRAPPAMAP